MDKSCTYFLKDRELLIAEAQELLDDAKLSVRVAINSPEGRESALKDLKACQAKQKEIDADYKESAQPLNDELQELRKHYAEPKTFLKQAIEILNDAVNDYDTRERARLLEEKRANAEAERLRREALEAEAEKARAAGHHDQANDLETMATYAPPVPVARKPPAKVAGHIQRELWDVEITDLAKLPVQHILPNMVSLRALARAQKKQFNVPGAKATCKNSNYFRDT